MARPTRLTDARLDAVVDRVACRADGGTAREVQAVVDEVRRLRGELADVREALESHQIADWVRFLPEHRVAEFLGELATAAVCAEVDGDPGAVTGVLTEWMAVADAAAARDVGDRGDPV